MTFHPALAAKVAVAAALLGSTTAAPAEEAPQAVLAAVGPATTGAAASAPTDAPLGTAQEAGFDAAEGGSFLPTPADPGNSPRAQRCRLPHLSAAPDARRLSRAGFRDIAFRGHKSHAARCSRFLYFSACRGNARYQVIVRYVKGRRSVVTLRNGQCSHGGRAA